jgi:4'-phosphopantetheinyl transferase
MTLARPLQVPQAVSAPVAPPHPLELPVREVHVWQGSLDAAGDGDAGAAALSEEERARADRLLTTAVRRRFVRSRAMLRAVLAGYLATDPARIRFETGRHGKPRLADADAGLRFNLSHSAACWVLAVGRDVEVGVDVERTARDVDVEAVARRMFRPAEIRTLRRLEGRARKEAFFRCWASREAVVKAMGEGMLTAAHRFEVACDPAEPPAVRLPESEGREFPWEIGSIPLPGGFCGMLATDGTPSRIRSWKLEPPR